MVRKNVKTDLRNLQQDVIDSAHKIWLAGLGALSTVEDEGGKWFQQLVDRGHEVEEKGKERMGKTREKVEARVKEARQRVESTVDEAGDTLEERLTKLLHKLGVPTRTEIQRLTQRVEELNAKVDRLKGGSPVPLASPEAGERKIYHVAPHGDEGWKVEAEGASRATSVHSTKEEAVNASRELAKSQMPSLVVIHKKDGSVQTEHSYDLETN